MGDTKTMIEEEFEGFLRCGFLAGGFSRFGCDGCGLDRFVPFSCKSRAVCPSCGGRRTPTPTRTVRALGGPGMAERAAHLADHVFPQVPVRQWVLTLVALTPRPRINLVLYDTVLGAHATWRSRLGGPAVGERARNTGTEPDARLGTAVVRMSERTAGSTRQGAAPRICSGLLQRSFGSDALACPRCGGRLRLIALIDDPRVIRRILGHLGLPTDVPAARRSRAPPIRFESVHDRVEDDLAIP